MKQITLKATERELGKKSDLKNMRKGEQIPCIIYGPELKENVLFSVSEKELKTITHTPNSYIINLDFGKKKQLAILHQVQYHPVTDAPLHVDFLSVSENRPVVIDVPIVITGNSEGVKQGGKLIVSARKLRVSGLIAKLPDSLVVDITNLKIGKQIDAEDLSFDGCQIVSPKNTIICSVKVTRATAAEVKEEDHGAAQSASEATS